MTARRGRPSKAPEDRMTHYEYVRMPKSVWDDVSAIALHLGYSINGGRSAAVRYAITKMRSLLPTKDTKK